MGALTTLLDGTGLVVVLIASGLGLLAMGGLTLVQGRSDIKRRTSEGAGALASGPRAEAQSLLRLVAHLETTLAGDPREAKRIRTQLVQAGFFDQRAVGIFFSARLGFALLFGAVAPLAATLLKPDLAAGHLWLAAAAAAIFGYFTPTLYLRRRIKQRIDQHRMGFPDFMDLMVVCAEAGLSMEAAIERIARELVEGYPSLAENLYMVSLEIRAGKSFTDALDRLGRRLAIEEASMLASLLQQSAELGTSLSQSLRIYSDEMRNKRMSRAEEKAYALPAKLVVPLTLFVFPILIVTLMYPAVVRVMGALKN